jgi:hypothetical protein
VEALLAPFAVEHMPIATDKLLARVAKLVEYGSLSHQICVDKTARKCQGKDEF